MWRRFLIRNANGEKTHKRSVGTPCPRVGLTRSKCVQQAINYEPLNVLNVDPNLTALSGRQLPTKLDYNLACFEESR